MCGRYTVGTPQDIEKRFLTSNKLPFFKPSWNIAPDQMIPVITKSSPNKITMMKWGFIWNKDAKTGVINIRSESISEKPFFKKFLFNKRCLIIADSFYEWGRVNLEGKEEKYPFNFSLKDGGLFGFAGIYNDLADVDGKPHYCCAIITTKSNSLIRKIHNRMPAIIERNNEDYWLDSENKDFNKLYGFLQSYPADKMKMHIVSKKVNNPKNDNPDLIKKYKLKQYDYLDK